MSKKIQLQIPEPCHENWNRMTPAETGRFCNSCQKNVVDFTGMSDSQLVAFFKKPSTGSVCGRFMNDQLGREIAIPKKRMPWMKYFFQISIPLFLASMKSQSQDKMFTTGDTVLTTCAKPVNTKIVIGKSLTQQTARHMTGRVVDEKGTGISFATVMIKGTKNGVACDNNGNFAIAVNGFDKKIVLVVSCVGFDTMEKAVDVSKTNSEVIILSVSSGTMGDLVFISTGITRKGRVTSGYVTSVMGGIYVGVKSDSILQSIKNFFVKDSLRVFPNPAISGSAIKIETRQSESGELQIELFNLQGQLMNSASFNSDEKGSLINYKLPNVIAGSYFLRITNKKNGKKQTEKIIIL